MPLPAEQRHELRILSYNLWEGHGTRELERLVDENRPDVLCVQECDDRHPVERIGDLHLDVQSSGNRLGMATYVAERFRTVAARAVSLRRSLHDYVMSPARQRLLISHILDEQSGQRLVVANLHASPLTATNSLRRRQIHASGLEMARIAGTDPRIMVGDYNYPWFQRGLRRRLAADGYRLTTSLSPTYERPRLGFSFTGRFDLACAKGLEVDRVTVLPKGGSDHRPILVRVRLQQNGSIPIAPIAPVAETVPAGLLASAV